MRIDNDYGNENLMWEAMRARKEAREAERAQEQYESSDTLARLAEESAEDGDEPSEDTQGRAGGVLGLLEEGHFKGVAALRLSLNFSEELAANAAEHASQMRDDLLAQLDEPMREQLATVPEELVEEATALYDEFVAHAESIEGGPRKVADQMGTAFANFMNDLEALVSGESVNKDGGEAEAEVVELSSALSVDDADGDTDKAAETAAAVEGETESAGTFDAAGFMDGVRDVYAAVAQPYVDQAAATDMVPPPPDNNGRAYDKFLAMYQEMSESF